MEKKEERKQINRARGCFLWWNETPFLEIDDKKIIGNDDCQKFSYQLKKGIWFEWTGSARSVIHKLFEVFKVFFSVRKKYHKLLTDISYVYLENLDKSFENKMATVSLFQNQKLSILFIRTENFSSVFRLFRTLALETTLENRNFKRSERETIQIAMRGSNRGNRNE